ncbi:MAG: hypothetical protein ACRCSP_08335 [Rhodoglobus sp.]
MRRVIITWSVMAAIVLGSFFITVAILNSTLYSASGFVHSYLDALQRRDAPTALDLAGPGEPSTASRALLTREAMGTLSDITFVSESRVSENTQRVVFSYTAGGKPSQSSFEVTRGGAVLGLFSTWRFATAPLSVVKLKVVHGQDFTANGVDLSTTAPDTTTPFMVFTPTGVTLRHDSRFLHADAVRVTAARPGASVLASLTVEANENFVDRAQREVDRALDACTTQQVLLPTGCPFGQQISDRVVSDPEWTITTYPTVSLVPGPEAGSWLVDSAKATAHLTVRVQSLFDGVTSTFDKDVPFTADYLVSYDDTGTLRLVALDES